MALPMLSPDRPMTPLFSGNLDTEDGPLWSTIKRQLYRSEVAHVKRLVGEALINKNRVMWDELTSLKQILTEFSAQNDELSEGLKQQVLFCGSQHRDLLRRQLQMTIADIKAQAEACGHDLEDILPEMQDPQMRDFVLGGKEPRLRRGSSGKLEGLTPPATPSTRPPSSCGLRPQSSGGRSGCSTPDVTGGCLPLPLGRALNLADLALVAEGTREALEAEHESLLTAIGEQMENLEVEADHQAHAVGRLARGEPSTAQLQEFSKKLQEVAASPNLRTLSIALAAPSSDSAESVRGGSSVRRLQALIAQRRTSPRKSSKTGLGAVPEASDTSPGAALPPTPCGGYQQKGEFTPGAALPLAAGPQTSFDPFFDDPLFAAAVGVS